MSRLAILKASPYPLAASFVSSLSCSVRGSGSHVSSEAMAASSGVMLPPSSSMELTASSTKALSIILMTSASVLPLGSISCSFFSNRTAPMHPSHMSLIREATALPFIGILIFSLKGLAISIFPKPRPTNSLTTCFMRGMSSCPKDFRAPASRAMPSGLSRQYDGKSPMSTFSRREMQVLASVGWQLKNQGEAIMRAWGRLNSLRP